MQLSRQGSVGPRSAARRRRIANPRAAERVISCCFRLGLFHWSIGLNRPHGGAERLGPLQLSFQLIRRPLRTLEPFVNYRGRAGFGNAGLVFARANLCLTRRRHDRISVLSTRNPHNRHSDRYRLPFHAFPTHNISDPQNLGSSSKLYEPTKYRADRVIDPSFGISTRFRWTYLLCAAIVNPCMDAQTSKAVS
jgi:hypothetical protein